MSKCFVFLVSILFIVLGPTLLLADTATKADFDGSGWVDFSDFLQFAGAYGTSQARYDLNGNGTVDFPDFLAFVSVYGQSVSPNIVTFRCNAPAYDEMPAPASVEGSTRYYEFYWQQDPKICVNTYEGVSADAKVLIEEVLAAGVARLGALVPINAFVWHNGVSDFDQVLKDWSALKLVTNLESHDYVAAGGVDIENLYNGGIIELTQGIYAEARVGAARKIIFHEFFHVSQNSHKLFFEEKNQFGIPVEEEDHSTIDSRVSGVGPVWLEEGSADFVAIYISGKEGWLDYRQFMTETLDEARSVIADAATRGDVVSLKDYETGASIGQFESDNNPTGTPRQFAYQYSAGSWAFAYLYHLADTNLDGVLINYWRNIAELERANPGQGYKVCFEQAFGISLDAFYTQFDAFMLLPRQEQLAILKD
jgi:hypothetical protein